MKQIELDSLYMDFAFRVAKSSYSKRKKVGCVIVKNNNIISYSWNGTPNGEDNCCEDSASITKESVIHAENNAIIKLAKSTESSVGSTIYTTLSPCDKCAGMLIQAEISRIVYCDEYKNLNGIVMLSNPKHCILVEKFKR